MNISQVFENLNVGLFALIIVALVADVALGSARALVEQRYRLQKTGDAIVTKLVPFSIAVGSVTALDAAAVGTSYETLADGLATAVNYGIILAVLGSILENLSSLTQLPLREIFSGQVPPQTIPSNVIPFSQVAYPPGTSVTSTATIPGSQTAVTTST